MISLTADQPTVAVLCQANELAEVRDITGQVMGFIVPLDVFSARLDVENHHTHDFVRVFCGEFRANFNNYTTRQVFEHLKTLTNDQAANADLQNSIDRWVKEESDRFYSPK